MHKTIPVILFFFLLTGCGFPRSTSTTDQQTPTLAYQQCAWVWSTQPLPDKSAEVLSAMQAAGLKDVKVNSEAYGENCIGPEGKVDHFAAKETDFRITVPVIDLGNKEVLGEILEKTLGVLDAFPPGKVPGPQPGNISVIFQTGKQEMMVSFTIAAGKSARSAGARGAELLAQLQKK